MRELLILSCPLIVRLGVPSMSSEPFLARSSNVTSSGAKRALTLPGLSPDFRDLIVNHTLPPIRKRAKIIKANAAIKRRLRAGLPLLPVIGVDGTAAISGPVVYT